VCRNVVNKNSKIRTSIYKKFEFDFKVFAVHFVTAGSGVYLTSGTVNVIDRRSKSLDSDVDGTAGSHLKYVGIITLW